MEALWILIGLLIGGLAVYFLVKPRVKLAETEATTERLRANDLDVSRQRLEIEISAFRGIEDRIRELTAESEKDRLAILDLTEKHSNAAACIGDRDKAITELKDQIAAMSEEAKENRRKLTELEIDRAAMSSTIAQREIALRDEREQFAETKAAFRAQFAELSAEALKDNGEIFLETAKRVLALQHQAAEGELDKRQEEIKSLVRPIEEGIKAVGEATRQMEATRATAFGTIEEQLRQSVTSAAEVAKQAGALKDALKRPNVRGRWGEVQLRVCVELAGMEEHCDVEFQETTLSVEDEALRPDMIVRMPGGRKITVDSKTPMVHFLSYIEASTDDERQTALINHGKSVKKHVGDLAKTDYMQKIAESPDFVVMFLPNESFLAMALEKEPTFMEEALQRKVLVATPGTLIGLLKVVQFGWNEQKIAQNAQRIADEGSKLNGEIVKFLADFAKLSLALDSVNEAFGSSRRRVENQIAKRSLSLTALGARNTSSLAKSKKVLGEVANILKAAGADDEDIEQTEDPEHLALVTATGEDENDE
jgi:DNA recombination protein RmuC